MISVKDSKPFNIIKLKHKHKTLNIRPESLKLNNKRKFAEFSSMF